MAGGSSVELLRDIQTLFESGTASGLTDRQLLERFIHHGDPAAFEVLVLRHGPMVLRVCRNRLHDPNDAQDAFQATFLILVRRSGSIRRLDSLASWLYGVACRAAARVRVGAARRRSVEERAASRVVEAVEPAEADEVDRGELGPIVQEEVRRLPEKYRAAVVLCYWEGLTQEQAAAQLGCPLGTVRSRLARARDLLHRRLTRRGVEPLAVGIDAIRRLPPLAPELVRSTVEAAARVAAGQATNQVVSGAIASLVQRMLWRTTMIKLSGVAAGVIMVGLAGYGVGIGAPQAGKPEAAPRSKPDEKIGNALRRGAAASTPQPIRADIEVETTVVQVVRNGTAVKKGDVICVLDSALLEDQLVDQHIAVKTVEAAYLNAKQTREVAEIAVREYVDGEYLTQLQDVQGDIRIAEAELRLAELVLNEVKPSGGQIPIGRAELAVLRARTSLEKAQSRKKLLVDYTRPKKGKELESAVATSRADELAKQATWELQVGKEHKLQRQLAHRTITAPMDGHVTFLMPLEEYSPIRPREPLFTIAPVFVGGGTSPEGRPENRR